TLVQCSPFLSSLLRSFASCSLPSPASSTPAIYTLSLHDALPIFSPVEAAQKGLNQILKRLLSEKRFFHSYVGQMLYSGDLLFRVTDLTLKRKRGGSKN